MSNERRPHKHAEVIKAWADGAQIQVRSVEDGLWLDLLFDPSWNLHEQYRVKPEPVKVRYRVALLNNGNFFTLSANTAEGAANMADQCSFVRWLTEWQEVEVPQ